MENQHRKITGYRELSQEEIDLMNEIKALGPQIEAVLNKIEKHLTDQYSDTILGQETQDPLSPLLRDHKLLQRIKDATPGRFVALAKTEFQTGLMYLTRAVAQPTFF